MSRVKEATTSVTIANANVVGLSWDLPTVEVEEPDEIRLEVILSLLKVGRRAM